MVSLADLKRALEKIFTRALEAGMVTVKSTIAYQRDLKFEEVSTADAQREFERLLRDEKTVPAGFRALENRPYRKLTNHMFHYMASLADAHRIPVQIHTGLQAGNGNFATNSRPSDLTNLFFLFPECEVRYLPHRIPVARRNGGARQNFSKRVRGFLLDAHRFTDRGAHRSA